MEGADAALGSASRASSGTGMIPRAIMQVFANTQLLSEAGWNFTMRCEYVEIYNEQIRDLLGDAGDSSNKKHEIKHDSVRCTTSITDVRSVVVESVDAVFGLLRRANSNRSVAATNCNERSSRSHSVFRLSIHGTNAGTLETLESTLNLIDLAGSERLSQSQSSGDRLKETRAINKSLSSLGDVVFALSMKDSHIPYRNSKLTYLLQHSLGGSSKVLMFVNVSPAASTAQETLCSLRFATKVNSCEIGTAKRGVVCK